MELLLSFLAGLAIALLGGGVVYFFWRKSEARRKQWLQVEKDEVEKRRLEEIERIGAQQKKDMELVFQRIAADSFQRNNKDFIDLAKNHFDQESKLQRKEVESLVKPLSENLDRYKKQIEETENKRQKDYGSLDQLLKNMVQSHEHLKSETSNLVNALKRPTVRGRWGEIQLKRVVELSGMSSHVDFVEQSSTANEQDDNRLLRPDMRIHLPNGRDIVVDAKATLGAYLEAEESLDERSRAEALQRHAASVRSRIMDLSKKAYWQQFDKSPEFVVLFIPGEAFFSAAVQELPELIEMGFEKRVILATPTTLMALLRAVAFGWQQEKVAQNSKKIAAEAARLYQALYTWSSHLNQVGVSLDRAARSYNQSVGSLERTVLPPARRLKELGVKSAKEGEVSIKEVETSLRIPQLVDPT